MSRSRRLLAIALAVPIVAGQSAAWAHHSAAMWDNAHSVELHGTVTRYEWTNPHVWIWLKTSDGTQEWGVEAHAVNDMLRMGWNRDSLKPGDAVSVNAHPRRIASTPTVSMITIYFTDGRAVGHGDARAPAAEGPMP